MDSYYKIKEKVHNIINFYSTNDPKTIADFLGIIILHSDLGSVEGFLQTYSNKYIIHVNIAIEDERKKDRIIAHELGHYFLHRHLNVFNVSTHTLSLEYSLEYEANIFSCELLLNDKTLEEELTYIQGMNIFELSAFFNLDYEIVKMKHDLFFLAKKEHVFRY
ncbi:putative toxin-antitoxin system, toxin component [Enterococcus faecalis 13-SD-W-01]|nr:putative toxin-antitoxin system, toxin component [Enterococcus faecalis 13-SD-W-01]